MERTLFDSLALFCSFEEVGVVVEQEYRIGEVLFSRGEIAERVSGLADRIAEDMRGKELQPLRCRLEKLSLKEGVKKIVGMREVANQDALSLGQTVSLIRDKFNSV